MAEQNTPNVGPPKLPKVDTEQLNAVMSEMKVAQAKRLSTEQPDLTPLIEYTLKPTPRKGQSGAENTEEKKENNAEVETLSFKEKMALWKEKKTEGEKPVKLSEIYQKKQSLRKMAEQPSPPIAVLTTQASEPVAMMDQPIPLIITDIETRKWAVWPEAIKVLNTIKGSLSSVSIVGKYRTGKSYLMNRIFNKNSGFDLGSTVQSKTKGIWLWAGPHPEDPHRCLILLDTEGLFDVSKGDETHDMQLCVLAVLLSNCLVYNTTNAIDEAIVHHLQFVTKLTEHIKIKEEEEETGDHFSKYFPSFFLVLRDFFLDLEIDGKKLDANQYMEHSLDLKPGHSKKNLEYNEPRHCIRKFFPNRRCFALPRPVLDNQKLKHLDDVKETEICQDFLDESKKAVDAIIKEAKPFLLDGHRITGFRFGEIAKAYVKSINDGAVPCIESTVDLLKDSECGRAVEEATKLYKHSMDDKLTGKMPVDTGTLLSLHGQYYSEAIDEYQKVAIFDERGTYVEKLEECLGSEYQRIVNENNTKSREKCSGVLAECFSVVNENVTASKYTISHGYKQYKNDKNMAISAFQARTDLGPMANKMLDNFLEAKQTEEEAIISADLALQDNDKEIALRDEKIRREEERAKVAEEEQRQLQRDIQRQEREHIEMVNRMQTQFDSEQRRLMNDHMADIERKEAEHKRLMNAKLTEEANRFQTMIDGLHQERRSIEAMHQSQMQQFESYKQEQARIMDGLKSEKNCTAQQLQSAQQELANLRNQLREQENRRHRGKKKRCIVM